MKRILSFVLLLSILLPTMVGTAHAFEDVPKETWYAEAVEYVQTRGLMLGVEEDCFQPEGVMSRAMAVTVAWRLCGAPAMAYNSMTYSDLTAEEWYWHAATWGFFSAVPAGFSVPPADSFDFYYPFGGAENVTRILFVGMLFRLAEYCGFDTSKRVELAFQDAQQVLPWLLYEMQWAVAEGLIEGSADGGALLLAPERNITRAEAAVMVMRYCERFQVAAKP